MKVQNSPLLSHIQAFIRDAELRIRPFVLSGELSKGYIQGYQYKRINERTLAIEGLKNTHGLYLERKIFNRMLPIYLTRYGILSQNQPIAGFKGTDNREETITNAIEGNKFLETFRKDINFNSIYKKAVESSDIFGLVWFKTGIDWSKGDEILSRDITITKDDKEDFKVKGTRKVCEGRTFVDVIPMHEVLVDSLAVENMDDINELCHRRMFSLEYIRKRWGFEAVAEDIDPRYFLDTSRYSDNNRYEENKYAYVYEYYRKPDALYPKGQYCILINNKILYEGELPYDNAYGKRKIPFVPMNLLSIPNHLVGVTVYSQIIPIQDTYNSIKNRLLEHINHLAIGQMYVWKDSLVNPDGVTNKPGQFIMIKRNAKRPEPVQKAQVGSEIINYLKSIEEDMLVTAGLSQISAYGMSKSSVRTDGVADKIGEADQNKLTNAIDNIGEAIIELFKQVLYIEKQRQKDLIEVMRLAKLDSYMVKYNLGELDPENLEIVNREFLMQSDQARQLRMTQASNLGVYNPQSGLSYITKLEILDALNSGYLKDTLDPVERASHDQIQEEHSDITSKIDVEVNDWDNHEQHILEHSLFRMSAQVRNLKRTDKPLYEYVVATLNKHITEHSKYKQDSQSQNTYQNAKAFLQ
jgi:hypothetical protein